MIDLYSAGSRVTAVRFVMILSLLAAAGGLWLGIELFRSYGLRPADGGVLAPFGIRLAWLLSLGGLGLSFAFGMWVYGRNYVRAMGYDPVSQALHMRMLGMLGDRSVVVPVARVREATFAHGRLANPVGVSVNAPWYRIRVEGRAAAYILDAQGVFVDRELLGRLLRISA